MVKKRLNILGVGVDPLRFNETVGLIGKMIDEHTLHHVVTVNPEFILRAKRDLNFRKILNSADLATADGFGIRLAATYLNKKITWIPIVREVQILLQGLWVGLLSIINRRILTDIPELVTGADLVWTLAKLAEQKGYTLYLLDRKGGLAPDTARRAAKRLQQAFPNLKIVGAETVNFKNTLFVDRINLAKPDFLFVAFGFPQQEFFIAENRDRLDVKVAIGVGGALDYIAGARARPPELFLGKFEWLWRLIIPSGHSFFEYWRRVKRILSAVLLFPLEVFLWKLRWGAGVDWPKVLTLDFGGVTNINGVERILRQAWQIIPLIQLPVLALFYFRFIPILERGEISEEEVWNNFPGYFGSKKDLVALRARIIDGFSPNDSLWKFIREIKASRKVKLALLTNNIKEWMPIWEKRYKLSHYFNPIIASCFVGKRKPNPVIFRLLVGKLNVRPEEIIFADDHLRNVLQARRLGIRAILFRNNDQCTQTLREILTP